MSAPDPKRPWAVGDIAVCVVPDTGGWIYGNGDGVGPARGQLIKVTEVYAGADSCYGECAGLVFSEFPDGQYPARFFRRIEPDTKSAEFGWLIEAIRRCGAQVPA